MQARKIKTALISTWHKEGIDRIAGLLSENGVQILSTGGTCEYLKGLGIEVKAVEELTDYPSILGGRVKTLHPKIFGGILAMRTPAHEEELVKYEIPPIDLVIVDLYPFEQTVGQGAEEAEAIEKIDIGGIALIRAAAKNFRDVLVCPAREYYGDLMDVIEQGDCESNLEQRKRFAARAFDISSHYDSQIFDYLNREVRLPVYKESRREQQGLRYGENPHQEGRFIGNPDAVFEKLGGKDLSYNNILDIDAALRLIQDFRDGSPAFAVIKHTNSCGLAVRGSVFEAWQAALAGDPKSAFGGILVTNSTVDEMTAKGINEIFYEVLIAPDYDEEAFKILSSRKKRIILRLKDLALPVSLIRTAVNGYLWQEADMKTETGSDLKQVTKRAPGQGEMEDLIFCNKVVKHLKSNAIALARDRQLIGIGCGQTSRVDALKQALDKARSFGFELEGAVLASDAFFPFADSVQMAHEAGIRSIIQPGGSIRDQDSIEYCDKHGLSMVFTGTRHFKH